VSRRLTRREGQGVAIGKSRETGAMGHGSSTRTRRGRARGFVLALATGWLLVSGAAGAQEDSQQNLAKVGAKLSNPLSDIWALFTEFDASFYDGNLNQGDDLAGSAMLFQPILPIPLHGSGWNLIT
jgi:hypothetical protein